MKIILLIGLIEAKFIAKKIVKVKNLSFELEFFTFKARLVFTKLRQIFIKALIFHYFDSECHIQIKTNKSNYVISRVLSQLIFNNLDQWY